jgi:carbon monoxide dehydrogenase subunit G
MKLEQSFEVAAPLERVWKALIDVERVAPCLPGAAVTGRNDDGSYDGTFKVKIGPTSAAYSGKLAMEQVDESAHTATMQAQGTDKRGQGGAKATIVSSLADAGDGSTRVEVSTDYHITGRLARFGRGGMIEDISNRLLGEFAKCLQSSLAGTPEGAQAEAESAAEAQPSEAAAASAPTEEAAPAEQPEAAPAGEAPSAEQPEAAPAGEAAPDEQPEAAPAGEAPQPQAAPTEEPAAVTPHPPYQPMPESEPVQGLSLMASALWGQAKRKPAHVVALLVGFLLALRVFRRRS